MSDVALGVALVIAVVPLAALMVWGCCMSVVRVVRYLTGPSPLVWKLAAVGFWLWLACLVAVGMAAGAR